MGLTNAVAKVVTNYGDENSIISKIRRKRLAPLLELIDQAHAISGKVNILDIGGTRQYWNILPKEILSKRNIRITLVNIEGVPKEPDDEHFHSLTGDGCSLQGYESNSFDIVHSNSVVEHVGDWQRMLAFAKEVSRLAPAYFVQTPNFWFPIEPHCLTPFFHWMPKPLRILLVRHFALGHWLQGKSVSDSVEIVESARLLDRQMFVALFPDATHITERFLTLPKSLIAVRRAQL